MRNNQSPDPSQTSFLPPSLNNDERLREVYRHAKMQNRNALVTELLRVQKESPGLITPDMVAAILSMCFHDASRITDLIRIRDLLKAFPGTPTVVFRVAALRSDDYRAMLYARKEFGMFSDQEILSRADVPKLLEVVTRKKPQRPANSRFRDDAWVKQEIRKIPDLANMLDIGKVLES